MKASKLILKSNQGTCPVNAGLFYMKEFQLSNHNVEQLFNELQEELKESPVLILSIQKPGIGKWGMARLWRAWMETSASFMASNGVTMPLMINANGIIHRTRPFNAADAHELFTSQWLGVDEDGTRLSWSKKGRDGMRAATKGERYHAMVKHDNWCIERGIKLFKPMDSEYAQMESQYG